MYEWDLTYSLLGNVRMYEWNKRLSIRWV